jgi:hypothetical protein
MDAYVYQAALYCRSCGEKLREFPSIAAELHHRPEDSDHYPQGPYPDGGGEADTPEHCDGCGAFLENPLTGDGVRYVNEALVKYARNGGDTMDRDVLATWAEHYNAQVYDPGSVTLEDLQFEYSMEDDDWGSCMSWWFTIAGELHTRGAPIPAEWKYQPGLHPVDPDDHKAPIIAGATSEVLLRFMEDIEDDAKRLRAQGKDC